MVYPLVPAADGYAYYVTNDKWQNENNTDWDTVISVALGGAASKGGAWLLAPVLGGLGEMLFSLAVLGGIVQDGVLLYLINTADTNTASTTDSTGQAMGAAGAAIAIPILGKLMFGGGDDDEEEVAEDDGGAAPAEEEPAEEEPAADPYGGYGYGYGYY